MLSEALRLLRVFHEMTQNDLSEKLGVSKSFVSELENNNRTPSLDTLNKYAEVFNVPVSSIIFFSENIENAKRGKIVGESLRRAIANKVIKFLQVIESRTEFDAAR